MISKLTDSLRKQPSFFAPGREAFLAKKDGCVRRLTDSKHDPNTNLSRHNKGRFLFAKENVNSWKVSLFCRLVLFQYATVCTHEKRFGQALFQKLKNTNFFLTVIRMTSNYFSSYYDLYLTCVY